MLAIVKSWCSPELYFKKEKKKTEWNDVNLIYGNQ